MRDRIELVDDKHTELCVRQQCELLGVARSLVDYDPVPESAEDIRAKSLRDETYLLDPCLGSRRLVTILEGDHGLVLNRKHVQRLRRELGQEAIFCQPSTSMPDHAHRKYPYLLRDLSVERPDLETCISCAMAGGASGRSYDAYRAGWILREQYRRARFITRHAHLVISGRSRW